MSESSKSVESETNEFEPAKPAEANAQAATAVETQAQVSQPNESKPAESAAGTTPSQEAETEVKDLEPIVYVVDDDAQACRAVAELVHSFGYQVRSYESPENFLKNVQDDRPGCVVLDLRMPHIDGLELQRRLKERNSPLPVVLTTAYADTPMTVKSLRSGAIAVLDKPFREDELWSLVQEAIGKSKQIHRLKQHQAALESRLKKLSPQDRAVLQLMLVGEKNRTIAKRLEVSLRTIENRRRRVFDVMEADSVAQLTRMVIEYEHNLLPRKNAHEEWMTLPFERVLA